MEYKEIIRKNLKFIIIMILVIILGVIGTAYAFRLGTLNPININTDTMPLSAIIDGEMEITSTSTMLPIEDKLIDDNEIDIINGNFKDERILRSVFTVSGVETNPENTIYDIALHNLVMDCELKTNYLKWRLYKDGNKISEGNFSPTFDSSVVESNRLVLTNEQQKLNDKNSTYTFLMWISESCPSDISITECSEILSQNSYINKSFAATIKIELSTKSIKKLVRNKTAEIICES